MLPAKLYEALPYTYVAVGSAMMLAFDKWLALLSGLLIAGAGARRVL